MVVFSKILNKQINVCSPSFASLQAPVKSQKIPSDRTGVLLGWMYQKSTAGFCPGRNP